MNQCWEYIIGTGEKWQCIMAEADNRRYQLQIGGVGLFGDEYRIYGCSRGQMQHPCAGGSACGFLGLDYSVAQRECVQFLQSRSREVYAENCGRGRNNSVSHARRLRGNR